MKFTISSSALLGLLQNTGKVIPPKATMPILDYFLFDLKENVLTVTASDLETTLVSKLNVDGMEVPGVVAVPSKLIIDSLRELSDQPIDFSVDKENYEITIKWQSGKLSIPGLNGAGYPEFSTLNEEERKQIVIPADWLQSGISKTVFATAESDLRPIMNGIYFDITSDSIVFVATDAHKLVKLTMHKEMAIDAPSSFILPKKPAVLLKGILSKEAEDVTIEFDSKNIVFTLTDYKLICRTIEGRYPNYNSVIPTNNINKVLIDRVAFLNGIKRVYVCSNQASNLIKISIDNNVMTLAAQDTDFSVSAEDRLECSYDGQPLTLGFKSTFMVEMLSNISSKDVSVELADATRAGLFIPYESDDECEKEMIMLLMPIMS